MKWEGNLVTYFVSLSNFFVVKINVNSDLEFFAGLFRVSLVSLYLGKMPWFFHDK